MPVAWSRPARTTRWWPATGSTRGSGASSSWTRKSPVHRDEDDVLGRAFDRRLLARLWAASRAHRRIILGSTLLFPVIAAVELAQPYLLKVAIDDHILMN